jgi:hypothetical protein
MYRWIILSLSVTSVLGCGSDGKDGSNGADAPVSLIDSESVEPADDECGAGGVRVFVGADTDGDGALGEDERQGSHLLCNGTVGADGQDGETGAEGADGDDGADGSDGVGSPGEAGEDGDDISAESEPPGDNCEAGGFEIFQNGVSLGFVCAGVDGEGDSGSSSPDAYVDGQDAACSDSQRGTEEVPNCTISAALYYVAWGGSVHVADGTYAEALVITRPVSLLGGYDDDWNRHLDPDPAVRGAVIEAPAAPKSALTIDAGAVDVTVEGFRIRAWEDAASDYGATAVLVNGSVTLSRNHLHGGVHREAMAQAVFVNGSGAIFASGNLIEAGTSAYPFNVATRGLYIGSPNAVLVNNVISSGSSTKGNSVGVYVAANGLVAANNTMVGGNSEIAAAEGSQGVFALASSGAASLWMNNQFVLGTSSAGNQRAHIQASYSEVVLLNNNLFDGAAPGVNEGYVNLYDSGSGLFTTKSDPSMWGGTCTVWPASAGCSTDSANNFDADPSFANAAGGDYSPSAGGSNTTNARSTVEVEAQCLAWQNAAFCGALAAALATDQRRVARVGAPDVGAFEAPVAP